jgi:Fur family ferric uptake transcriptional regulator
MSIQDSWHRSLRNRGLRLTIPRREILTILNENEGHLSAEDIYIQVHEKHPAIGLTTVYRTLDLLVQLGFVFKFDFGDGRARYELMEKYSSKDHHHHLICSRCSQIIDYTDFVGEEIELIRKTEHALSEKYGYRIIDHMVQFYGLCGACQRKS